MMSHNYKELSDVMAFCLFSLVDSCYSKIGQSVNVNSYLFPKYDGTPIDVQKNTVYLEREDEDDPTSELVLNFHPTRYLCDDEFTIHDGDISYLCPIMPSLWSHIPSDTQINTKSSLLMHEVLKQYTSNVLAIRLRKLINTESNLVQFLESHLKSHQSVIRSINVSGDSKNNVSNVIITFNDGSELVIELYRNVEFDKEELKRKLLNSTGGYTEEQIEEVLDYVIANCGALYIDGICEKVGDTLSLFNTVQNIELRNKGKR